MGTRIRSTGALLLVGVLISYGTARALDAPADGGAELGPIVQLPVAVARAVEAGAPPGEVAALMHEMRLARSPALDVIEILRAAPAAREIHFPTRLDGPDAPGVPLSDRARFFRQQGLRGPALAREIRSELRAQGIPVGDALAQRGPLPISRGFVPQPAEVEAPGRAEGPGSMERRHPPEDRPLPTRAGEARHGPPVEAEREARPGNPPVGPEGPVPPAPGARPDAGGPP